MATINGTSGGDSLVGGTEDDLISGLEGNDTLDGGAGNDSMSGGDGDDVFTLVDLPSGTGLATGNVSGGTPELVNQSTSTTQSPPKMLVLDDGRVLYVWNDNALASTTNMDIHGRIYNADGTPSSDQFQIGTWGVDGNNSFDIEHIDLAQTADGNVFIGYIRSVFDGGDAPAFSVIDPSFAPTDTANFQVATDQLFTAETNNGSPPVLTTLDDGRVLAVWSRNGDSDSGDMSVQGRIFNSDGTASTSQFQIGTWDVDGSNYFDLETIDVVQADNGNVFVGYVRDSANGGEVPVFSVLDPSFNPGDAGFTPLSDQLFATEDPIYSESPPLLTALDDGRILAVWNERANLDTSEMNIEGRIFNGDGTPATAQFQIGTWGVDGYDTQNTNHIDVAQTSDGNVVVGFVRSGTNGLEEPAFSIIDPSLAPTDPSFAVISDVEIQQTDPGTYESPPVLAALGDGRFVAVWKENWLGDGDLHYRVFNSDGSPVTDDITVTTANSNLVDTSSNVDVNPFSVVATGPNSFTIGWVGASDGSGTGTYTSGPITLETADGYGNDTIVGGEAGESDGDTIDGSNLSSGFTVTFTGDEAGTIYDSASGPPAPTGNVSGGTPELVNQSTSTGQSPPKMLVLDDGRVLYVWNDNAASDTTNMDIHGRIYNADGTPSSDQFQIGTWGVSGNNAFDIEHVDLAQTADGNVYVGYIRNIFDGGDAPAFSVIDPSFAPTDTANFQVATDQLFTAETDNGSPPVLTTLDDGRVLAVWSRNGDSDSGDMSVQGRIFNSDGTASTSQFQIGTWDVDGSNYFDIDTIDVVQAENGNVFVGYVRDSANGGEVPVFSVLDPSFNPSDAGFTPLSDQLFATEDPIYSESPPILTALDDGRILAVWNNSANLDNSTSMSVQGRIFNEDGTPATSQFQIGTWAVDGYDSRNIDALDVVQTSDGNIVVGFVRNTSNGTDEPAFQIIDPSLAPTDPNFAVATNVEIQATDAGTYESAPVLAALGGGRFVAVWKENELGDGNIAYRVFNSDGTPVTDDIVVSTASNNLVDSGLGFDVSSISVVATGPNSFTIGWVGASDGSATGTYTSGPISLELNNDSTVDFSEIENIIGTNQDDVVDASVTTQGVNVDAGGGNDTVTGGAGADSLSGGDGQDTIVGGAGEDTIAGGAGADNITGGTGADVLDYSGSDAGVSIDLGGSGDGVGSGGHAEGDVFNEVDDIIGSGFDDTLSGYDAAYDGRSISNIIDGGAGNDSIDGEGGNDSLIGGTGNDTLIGGAGDDLLSGGDGNDTITGDSGTSNVSDVIGDDFTTGWSTNGGVTLDSERATFLTDNAWTNAVTTTPTGMSSGPGATGGAQVTFDLAWSDGIPPSTSGSADFWLEYDGVGYVQITTPDDGSVATITYHNGASGGTTTITEGDAIAGTGFTTLTIDLPPGIPDSGQLQFWADTSGGRSDNFSIDNVIVTRDGQALFGNDTIDGGAGNDSIDGEDGNDSLIGGTGNDTLIGGAGIDTLTGGADADTFFADGTADLITDFDTSTGIGDNDPTNNDFIDLSAIYNETTLAAWNAVPGNPQYANPLQWLKADQADNGVLDEASGLQIQNGGVAVDGDDFFLENTAVVCFTRGTGILTPFGEIPIEDLERGDMVKTLDHGTKPIRWIGHRKLSAEDLAKAPEMRPIRIEARSMGGGLPKSDLIVSPQHRLFIRSRIAKRMFGKEEVLIAAKHLLGVPGVSVVEDSDGVEYWHFLFDQHEIVFAECMPSESLYTGQEALKTLSEKSRAEIFTLFPELADLDHDGLKVDCPSPMGARIFPKGPEARELAKRHVKNHKALWASECFV